MEMYTTDSSFGTSLTLQTPNTFRDVSFSSYLNEAEENMIRKLTNQASDLTNDRKESEEDEELGVFGAEKYFNGEIEDLEDKKDGKFVDSYSMHRQDKNIEELDHDFFMKVRIDQANTRTPSVRSNVSGNSRVGLLNRTKQAPGKVERASRTRSILNSFGCNCINVKSTQTSEKKFIHAKEISDQKTRQFSSKLTERKSGNDYFCFPVLNPNDLNSNSSSNSKSGVLAGKVEGDHNNGGRLSLGKKLALLNDWDVDVDIPTEDEMRIPATGMYSKHGGGDSDSSSDLFEIESFSTTENSSFIAHRRSEANCYAPSEVSVDWSVVTASAADFSVVSDYEECRAGGGGWRISGGNDRFSDSKYEQKKRPGLLSGCTSYKAVRVAGDECKISGGPAGGRRRLPDSTAVGSIFRG